MRANCESYLMHPASQSHFKEALSFLSPELRAALAVSPDGSACSALPERQVALLWLDVSGFSHHTRTYLSQGAEGVDELHRKLNAHYDQVINTVLHHGGEPVTFVGDGLLSVWPADPQTLSDAVLSAVAAARDLAGYQANGQAHFELNHHISVGTFQMVELGGRHGRVLTTSMGSALQELGRIADIKEPNDIILTADAAALCSRAVFSDPIGAFGARKLLICPTLEKSARTDLAAPSEDAWEAIIARMPRFAAGWLESVGLEFLAELRPVTAISIDLSDFDQAATDAATQLDEIVQTIQDVVHARDGYVAEVIVDEKGVSVLVTFGTPPDAHSDDPLRAMLSAREIHTALALRSVASSLGVATARMLCCIVGNDDRRSSLVLGDAVIRSTRLASAAENAILVDDPTMRATQAQLSYDPEPAMLLFKGENTPAPAWSPGAAEYDTAQVQRIAGRQHETDKLHQCWGRVDSGIYGTNIVVEGESGFGKTSLAQNLRHHVEDNGGVFQMVAASAIEQDAPYSALRHLVMTTLGVQTVMSADIRQEKIAEHLPYQLRDRAPFLNAIFPTGLPENAFTAELTGQARAIHIQNFVVDLLGEALSDAPNCLCIDDARWLDGASRDVLARLADAVPHLMIVILTQPMSDRRWAAFAQDAGFEFLRLAPLSPDGLHDLICMRLGCTAIDDQLFEQLDQQTERHPFYATEVLRNLIEAEAIIINDGTASLAQTDALNAAALPDTLHGMVLQRFDRLAPADQLLLRVASVAGMDFSTQLLCAIHPIDNTAMDIAAQVDRQVANGFLVPQREGTQSDFAFANGILREVAHSQMPRQQSRRLHASVAQWINDHAGEDRAGRLLELGHHWSEAGHRENAVGCFLEEALRLFSQGFAVDAVQVGLRAIRTAGVKVPDTPAALQREIQQSIAEIEKLTAGRHPTELLTKMQPPPEDLALSFQAILSTAPFAFQSNQFEMFAWASVTAMRLVMENQAGPPHAFSMYSIVRALLTGDPVAGAAWSRAALDLDAATGGSALPAAGFIDTWFHSHWRTSLHDSVEINQAAAARALKDNDPQYASYNVAGGVILSAAMGRPLDDVIVHADDALNHQLHRNARMHIHLERQFARALQAQTLDPLSFSDDAINEDKDIGWVAETEFANQTGYYLAARARLHRYAGDWDGAVEWYDKIGPLRGAIAGQIVEVDLIQHILLARFARILAGQAATPADTAAVEEEMKMLTGWSAIHAENFGTKATMAAHIWAGIQGDMEASKNLIALAAGLGPDHWLQDRALAFEYAARLAPNDNTLRDAVDAYNDWGATGVANRLSAQGL